MKTNTTQCYSFHLNPADDSSSKLYQSWKFTNKYPILYLIVAVCFFSVGCRSTNDKSVVQHPSSATKNELNSRKNGIKKVPEDFKFRHPNLPPRPPAPNGIEEGKLQRATFAGGCFWCMEKPFEDIPGVQSVTSGYTGGTFEEPSYKAVSSHSTDQVEAIDIIFDPKVVSFNELLDVYWRQIDPTDDGGQFVDRGNQYRPFIWVHNDEQRNIATESKKKLELSKKFSQPIIVPIEDAVVFWPAEEYHQDFYKKDPTRYHGYRAHSGRDTFLNKYWKTNH